MNQVDQVIALTNQMSISEKTQVWEHLRRALELEAYQHMPWEAFLRLTYGSLADDPIGREQPLVADIRDDIL
ncbi:MAG: hypothetical protein H7Y11_04350 [Armatimonadetes bacterium]|nr:hypothetical protein [Anaerolineae bacterium]